MPHKEAASIFIEAIVELKTIKRVDLYLLTSKSGGGRLIKSRFSGSIIRLIARKSGRPFAGNLSRQKALA